MIRKSENGIQQSMLREIKKGQTALIISRECGETMVIVNNSRKAYGAETHIMNEVKDFDKIERVCRKTGFPTDFVYLPTSNTGEVYISMECAKESLPIAICVKELEEGNEKHLKLCKVWVEDYTQENKFENEM